MASFEEIGENIGAFAGGCFGALGYTAGPVVGTLMTAGGGSSGYFVGKLIGKGADSLFGLKERADEIAVNARDTLQSVDDSVKRVDTVVGNIGKSVAIINGCGVLAVGVSLGVSLYFSDAKCHPECVNTLAETIRLSSLALTITGVGIIGFTGLRNLFA